MNSPHCINTEAAKGHDYYPSLPALILGSVLSSQPTRLVLSSLGLAAVCNVGRILIQWVVDASQIKGVRPDISGVTYVEDPLPYIERKLLTVNTGNSAIAYLGYARGKATIHAALEDPDVRDGASKALEETGLLLAREYGCDPEELREYRQKVLARFGNPRISDEVTRVARPYPQARPQRTVHLPSPAPLRDGPHANASGRRHQSGAGLRLPAR
jgi:hypothetical protein